MASFTREKQKAYLSIQSGLTTSRRSGVPGNQLGEKLSQNRWMTGRGRPSTEFFC